MRITEIIKLKMRVDEVNIVKSTAISLPCYNILLFYKKTIVKKNTLMNIFTMMPALSIACK